MINASELKQLAEYRNDQTISIYVPTTRVGQHNEDRLRFKNALKEASHRLQDMGLEDKDADKYLKPAYELVDDEEFWSHQSDGLAAFISKDGFQYHTLPVHFDHMVHISDRYYLRPIVPMMNGENRFFILALSQNEVRFFEGHQYSVTPVEIKDLVPDGIDDTLIEPEGTLQMHSASGGNAQTPQFHGQGTPQDEKDKILRYYLHQVDKGLLEMLHDENAPMVVVADDAVAPYYLDISKYSNVVNDYVSGNPENDDPATLHEKAWNIVREHFTADRREYHTEFGNYMSDGKAAVTLMDIVPAALDGRVEALFLVKGTYEWGEFDPEKRTVQQHGAEPRGTELLDMAAVQTFMNGGKVYQVDRNDMPQSVSNANAIFRY